MGDALGRGVVLVMSLWDDHDANMQWLDGVTPKGSTKEGSMRGSCDPNGGNPDQIENQYQKDYHEHQVSLLTRHPNQTW